VLTVGVVGNVCLLAGGAELGSATAEFVYDAGYWDEIDRAGDLLDSYDEIAVPEDVAIDRNGERHEVRIADLSADTDAPAKDVGSRTVATYGEVIANAGTVILNGPAGVFEEAAFAAGTRGLYEAATRAEHSIVGGGDTAAAVRELGIEGFDHVSTGGGAALRLLTGDTLPAVEALR
jgi:phosphoglycerate kinase